MKYILPFVLRTGNKIPVIENVGATEDQFDTIDLSDNEIVKLENFPNLNRLGTLLLNNNRITRINTNLGEFLPKLHTLVLTNNRLTNLVEIDPLVSLLKLQYLSLLDNNITKKPNYRLYVIHKLTSLRVLDFRKIKQKDAGVEHSSHDTSSVALSCSLPNASAALQAVPSQLCSLEIEVQGAFIYCRRFCHIMNMSTPSHQEEEQRESANIFVSSTAENTFSREVHDDDDIDKPEGKRQKKTTSEVWDYFTKVSETIEDQENGKKNTILWAQCNKCKYKASGESTNGIKVFWNHLKNKHSVLPGQQILKLENKHRVTTVEPYRYDQEASLRKFHITIIMHEYPFSIVEHEYFVEFIKSLRPSFPMRSRKILRKELIEIFTQEKEKLYEYFKTVKCRFSTTMDMWTSNQNKGYMCVTVHWVDEDWHIQKRIIKFMHVGGRHTGVKLSEVFISSVMRWFIKKELFSLTLDNASANEVCVKEVISELGKICPLICDGMFFHVRCANHILNLVARDGLAAIASTIKNIRAFVVAVKSSPLQWEEFMKFATECQLDTKKGVALDVATRWNSTYLMLKDALYYKTAFHRLLVLDRHRYENIIPSDEEWGKALSLCKCLKKFSDITELLSGTLYPTANIFYRNFCEIKLLLREWCVSDDITIKTMSISMTAKFDKYWKKSNIALVVASFLDPRFKKRIIEFFMSKFHGEIGCQAETERLMKIVKQLYQQYSSDASDATRSSAVYASHGETSEVSSFFMEKENDELDDYLYKNFEGSGKTNDLEKYIGEPPLMVPKSENFDILSWWKAHQHVYPILSKLARDVLAMQVSTVASESAFSAGGRVIDPFRSRLDSEVVEALVCTKDWLAASKQGFQNDIQSIVGDLEVLETLVVAANTMDQVEEEIDSDDD